MPGCRLKPIYLDDALKNKYLVESRFKQKYYQKLTNPTNLAVLYGPLDNYSLEESNLYFKQKVSFLKKENKPIQIEIACGTGDFLIALAKENKNKFFIGVDYALPCLQRAVKKASQNNLENILFYYGSAEDFLANEFFNFVFDKVMINFPDPWPKKKHVKRRLINAEFLSRLWKRVSDKTDIITATDVYFLYIYHNSLFKYSLLYQEVLPSDCSTIKELYYLKISKYQKKNLSGSNQVFYTHYRKLDKKILPPH